MSKYPYNRWKESRKRADAPDKVTSETRGHDRVEPIRVCSRLVVDHTELLQDNRLVHCTSRLGVVRNPLRAPTDRVSCLSPAFLQEQSDERITYKFTEGGRITNRVKLSKYGLVSREAHRHNF